MKPSPLKNLLASKVFNRGTTPRLFLLEMAEWAKSADAGIFAPNQEGQDIYSKVKDELGTSSNLVTRKAIMLDVMRVLAGFESSWDWTEGVDTSKLLFNTPTNAEAGAWQVSHDSISLHSSLLQCAMSHGAVDSIKFQQAMKFNHTFAMEYVARLMRINTRHNGPLYKGKERLVIRKSLRGDEHSIYPWLKRECVSEFEKLICA